MHRPQLQHRWSPFDRRAVIFSLAMLLALAGGTAQAQQWKWRDKNGSVTISDRPPPREVADKDILSRPAAARFAPTAAPAASAASDAASSAGKTALDKEVEARRKALEQEQAAKQKADEAKSAARRAENCQRARSQLGNLESGKRMTRPNDKGEPEPLDDQAREQEVRSTRELIASECR